MIKFKPGDRVVVSTTNHFAPGAVGTCKKFLWETKLVVGTTNSYLVAFDEPHPFDMDGDGPYFQAEMLETALSFVEPPQSSA